MFAPHYARPLIRACGPLAAPLWPTSRCEGEPASELLPGEAFGVLEYAGGSAWGSCHPEPLVGYVEADALIDPATASHVVCVPRAPVGASDGVAPAVAELPMGALLAGQARDGALVTGFGTVALDDVRPLDDPEPDAVSVAERLIGAPFRVGGRTAAGIDSVGLVQLALSLCGVSAPRLLDLLNQVGEAVPEGSPTRRGDLILFGGGAGLAIDATHMIHACPAAGKVHIEAFPLSVTERRRLAR